MLQGCPATHWPRIRRHNEIAKKLGNHCKLRGWEVASEPHIRHADGTLFKPDLVVVRGNEAIISDVQVCWEGDISLAEANERKRLVYDNHKFKEAFKKTYPDKTPIFHPITLGARGIWPRCNEAAAEILAIPTGLKASCVHSCLKWASSIHTHFGKTVWRKRN